MRHLPVLNPQSMFVLVTLAVYFVNLSLGLDLPNLADATVHCATMVVMA